MILFKRVVSSCNNIRTDFIIQNTQIFFIFYDQQMLFLIIFSYYNYFLDSDFMSLG